MFLFSKLSPLLDLVLGLGLLHKSLRDKFETGTKNNYMYRTYAPYILKKKARPGENKTAFYKRLVTYPRPTFQQFADYIIQSKVTVLSNFSRRLCTYEVN